MLALWIFSLAIVLLRLRGRSLTPALLNTVLTACLASGDEGKINVEESGINLWGMKNKNSHSQPSPPSLLLCRSSRSGQAIIRLAFKMWEVVEKRTWGKEGITHQARVHTHTAQRPSRETGTEGAVLTHTRTVLTLLSLCVNCGV